MTKLYASHLLAIYEEHDSTVVLMTGLDRLFREIHLYLAFLDVARED